MPAARQHFAVQSPACHSTSPEFGEFNSDSLRQVRGSDPALPSLSKSRRDLDLTGEMLTMFQFPKKATNPPKSDPSGVFV